MERILKGQKYTKEQAVQLVQHCYAAEEPIFIIRAKDKIAWKAIKAYAEILKNSVGPEKAGSPEYDLAEAAEKFAAEVIQWQGLNMEKVKLPD